VVEDRPRDRRVVGRLEPMARALEAQQPRARDLLGQRDAVPDREQRVGRPVDDERRRGDVPEPVAPRLAVAAFTVANAPASARALATVKAATEPASIQSTSALARNRP